MMQSKELTMFYRSYRAWVKMGVPKCRQFRVNYGLCSNLVLHSQHMGYSLSLMDQLDEEMKDQFTDAQLNYSVPFNDPKEGDPDYMAERNIHHLNPKRMAWVEAHCDG